MKTLKKSLPFWIFAIVSIGLFIGGFFVPPMGEIDGSVLTAGGILFAFAALWTAHTALESGKDVTLSHGDTSLTLGDDDD